MPHLEDFFTHGDNGTNVCLGPRASINDTVRPSPREADEAPDCSVLYVHGPEHAGQTSLLLQFGFTQVKAGKNVVLVMCGTAGMSQQPAASEIVPLSACSQCQLPLQTGNDNSLWSRLHIKYLRNATELQHFLCSLHVVDSEVSVLLIDGFETFFADESNMSNVYQTLAFLLEARDFMDATTGGGVAMVAGHSDAVLLRKQSRSLLHRWCRFLELVPAMEEPDVYIIREEIEDVANVTEDTERTQVTYAFTLSVDDRNGTFQLLHVQRPGR
uniref:DNA recombination and repair protein Rad51-like C-terminal domain-containing protein n=1 Tax=Hyaloperonospora arabidopsidis (strain Emoy2) TaxID=559515 RepID=M4BJ55_HYAAE